MVGISQVTCEQEELLLLLLVEVVEAAEAVDVRVVEREVEVATVAIVYSV